jgi:hypothetical protein
MRRDKAASSAGRTDPTGKVALQTGARKPPRVVSMLGLNLNLNPNLNKKLPRVASTMGLNATHVKRNDQREEVGDEGTQQVSTGVDLGGDDVTGERGRGRAEARTGGGGGWVACAERLEDGVPRRRLQESKATHLSCVQESESRRESSYLAGVRAVARAINAGGVDASGGILKHDKTVAVPQVPTKDGVNASGGFNATTCVNASGLQSEVLAMTNNQTDCNASLPAMGKEAEGKASQALTPALEAVSTRWSHRWFTDDGVDAATSVAGEAGRARGAGEGRGHERHVQRVREGGGGRHHGQGRRARGGAGGGTLGGRLSGSDDRGVSDVSLDESYVTGEGLRGGDAGERSRAISRDNSEELQPCSGVNPSPEP